MNYILGSSSPRRRELFKFISNDFTVIKPQIDETVPSNIDAFEAAEYIALKKCDEIRKAHFSDIVLTADTVVINDGKILGKPKNREDAFNILKSLSGKTHYVVTGCAIGFNGKTNSFSSITKVKFLKLNDNDIKEYIATGEADDKAGAYGIQGKASLFIESIEGDYFNVVGLPISKVNYEINKIKQQDL